MINWETEIASPPKSFPFEDRLRNDNDTGKQI